MVKQHYRWDFIGLSTDNKPTADNVKVTEGSTFYESDTSKYYIWHKDRWYEKVVEGGGGGDTTITISASQEGSMNNGVITAYDKTTGVITGKGFGSSKGLVFLLDRDTHFYISQAVDTWSDTEIKLKQPIDTSTIEGYTSIVAVDSKGLWTAKLMLDGDVEIATDYGYAYVRNRSTGEIEKLELVDFGSSGFANNTYNRLITLGNKSFYSDDVVGLMLKDIPYTGSAQNYLFYGLQNLNQPIKIPFNAWRYDNCLSYCSNFNQPIAFLPPQSLTGQQQGANQLSNCDRFNQPFVFSSYINIIGSGFMRNNFSFSQEVEIPSTVNQIGSNFMDATSIKRITLKNTGAINNYFLQGIRKPCEFIIETETSSLPSATNSITANAGGTCEAYTVGFTFKGSQRSAWLTAFPTTTASPWRYVIDGGA